MHPQEPSFYDIEMIGLVSTLLRSGVDAIEEQLETLQEVEARHMACVLDAETLDRLEVLYTAVQYDAGLYTEQLRRWRAAGLTSSEAEELAVLDRQVKRLRDSAKELVAIGERLRMQLS